MKNKAKEVYTYDPDGYQNGYLMELQKKGELTIAYLTVAYPQSFKGYHLHKIREANYICIKGSVTIILFKKSGKEKIELEVGDKLHIPTDIPTGIKNYSTNEEAWIINFPNPPYDPSLKDEQVDFNEKEVFEWMNS